jgi:phosphoserine phosphatase
MVQEFPFVLNVIGQGAIPRAFWDALDKFGEPKTLRLLNAFDLPFDGDPISVLKAAREIAKDTGLDVNVLPAENRKKKLLVADMDSTIIAVECLDELADMAGLKPAIAAITERAMRGEIEFEAALRQRVGMLKGLPLSALEKTYAERVRLNPGAKSLVATMRAHGAHTLLVSGGFGYFTTRVAAAAGFHAEQGNRLLDDGIALTGEVGTPILGREAKLKTLEDAVARLGITFAESLAVGDGANDLAMIQKAGLGVAYHAKPVVAEAAGASIAHNDLTALLYLQGYRDSEITQAA